MKVRIASDIHLELYVDRYAPEIIYKFLEHILPPLPDDKESLLILAGDVINFSKPGTFVYIHKLSERFRQIIQVFGNHEWYHGDLNDWKNYKLFLSDNHIKNVNILQSGYSMMHSLYLDNNNDPLNVVGGTLWTNYDNDNPVAKAIVQNSLNDYRLIKKDGKLITANDILEIHKIELNWIKYYLPICSYERSIVVTHHGPFLGCIHQKYKNSGLINYGFASNLSEDFKDCSPNYHIFGHTHSKIDFVHNQTRVIANPVGYANLNTYNLENKEYNPTIIIEI